MPAPLRIALFSGNYNYVRDGANQALNRLVGYLLGQGHAVRVYSPTTATPAFPPVGDLVSIPAFAIPKRPEYRFPTGLTRAVRRDLADFNPDIVHISSPDIAARQAIGWARRTDRAAIASIHTRFETYLSYYHLQLFEPALRALMRRLYRQCDALLVPAESTAAVLRAQRMNRTIFLWTRGVDREQFNPGRRDLDWRRAHGIADDEVAIAFLGRLVLEKGLDVFSDAVDLLTERGVAHKVLVIGDGPARAWFAERLPNAVFTGQQVGADLARALASGDIFLNPSVTEAFGNVTLEAMACGLPVVAAAATGANSIVQDGYSGTLVEPGEIDQYADALEAYIRDPALRHDHGSHGLAHATTQDWTRINAAVEAAYYRVIERRARIARTLAR
ncbi:MAG: glycosyltransferase family 1 protein [Pseudomonadota bacterium]|jgi:phosphatidylinositol alpha 1,6-mannosyltransferase|nr:glycosyltransferase family 1 protein [Pseudomonadota bacterium]